MATKKNAAIPNWKKKKWYEILTSEAFSSKSLGETLLETPDLLNGKVVTVNMMTLLGTPKKQNFQITFSVTEVVDNKGIAKPVAIRMLPSGTKRLIRPGKDRIDQSFVVKTQDGFSLRVKPLLITKTLTSHSKITSLQEKTQEKVTEIAAKTNYEGMFVSVSQGTLQKELKSVLDKVYPVKLVEIRALVSENKK